MNIEIENHFSKPIKVLTRMDRTIELDKDDNLAILDSWVLNKEHYTHLVRVVLNPLSVRISILLVYKERVCSSFGRAWSVLWNSEVEYPHTSGMVAGSSPVILSPYRLTSKPTTQRMFYFIIMLWCLINFFLTQYTDLQKGIDGLD